MKLRCIGLGVLLCVAVVHPTISAVIYVNGAQTNNVPDGQSWPTAFGTVREGIQGASNGDSVWVAAGTYFENLTITNTIELLGGFNGTETDVSQRDWKVHLSILDGSYSNSVVKIIGTTNVIGGTNGTRLDGFVIQHGQDAPFGAGVYCSNASSVIANNSIVCNRISAFGGAIYCGSSTPTIVSNLIRGNSGPTVFSGITGGVGITCSRSSPKILHNQVIGSIGGTGGIDCSYANSVEISNNLLLGNQSLSGTDRGGGITLKSVTSASVVNNTIIWSLNNGISCNAVSGSIANNIIAYSSYFGMVGVTGMEVRNNCVFSNAYSSYSGVPDQTGTNGNISFDPQFVSNPWYPDVHLQATSPCRDAGDTSLVPADSLDIDGEARVIGTAVDIGADEFNGVTPVFTPDIVRVSTTGSDDNDGSTWAKARRTVQAAINQTTAHGGEVWVQSGEYLENLYLQPFVHIFGGFSGNETSREERDWQENASVLDGNQQGSVITMTNLLQWNAIDGFVIRNGRTYSFGGGIYCDNSSPIISHNIITNNTAIGSGSYAGHGGGIWCRGGSPVVSSNIIGFNRALVGAGIDSFGAAPLVLNNRIEGNVADIGEYFSQSAGGGGIYVEKGKAEIEGNFFLNNVATNTLISNPPGRGGGISVDSSATAVEILNNTFIGNSAEGGGVYFNSPKPVLVNNLFVLNSSGILTVFFTANDNLRNNCVFGNATNYLNMPDFTSINGNISVDPLLVATNDYHLGANSPCINSGNNSFVTETSDLDGEPRIAGGTVDIGADEFQNSTSAISYAWLQQYGFPADGSADSLDSDFDSANNWQEWIAGTVPTNSASLLKLLSPVVTESNVVVSWQSVAGKSYFLDRSTNLASIPAFATLQSNIVGAAGMTSYTDTNAVGSGPFIYRVGVRP